MADKNTATTAARSPAQKGCSYCRCFKPIDQVRVVRTRFGVPRVIFLPDEYPREWVMEKGRFWNEQYLLQAFLTFNHAWEVLVANAFLGRHHREELKAAFPSSPWLGGGSFWMRRREL